MQAQASKLGRLSDRPRAARLAEAQTITMPIQETFWATRFGMFVDQFGTPWMINCEKAAAKAA